MWDSNLLSECPTSTICTLTDSSNTEALQWVVFRIYYAFCALVVSAVNGIRVSLCCSLFSYCCRMHCIQYYICVYAGIQYYIIYYYVCMQMGKRRFRLSVQRKNDERKRWGVFPVRIPVKGGVSVFKVSVPLSSLTTHQRDLLTSTLPVPTSIPKSTSALPATPLLNALLRIFGS